MYTCKNCGQTYSDPVKFCGKCGGDSFETQQQGGFQQPDYGASYGNPTPEYTYAAPTPAPATASKAPAIMGMIFGIIAMIFSLSSIIIASEAIELADYYDSFYYYYRTISSIQEEAFAALGVLGIFMVPSIILGLVMSFKNSGLKAMSIIGRVTTFVGLGLWILSFIMVGSI